MKKSRLLALSAIIIFACCSPAEEKETTNDTTAATPPAPVYPFPATYSSDWKIGNPEQAKIVLYAFKAIEENRVDELEKYLADTITSHTFDDRERVTSKTELISRIKKFRDGLSSFSEEFIAFVPLHSNDKDEDWVATWMKERVTRKNGTKDSTLYMESFRFNKDNKIYYTGGFARY